MLLCALPLALLQPTPDLLTRVRAAVTVERAQPWAETVLTGTAQFYGTPATYSFRFTPDGRFVQEQKSRLGESSGFDGKTAWAADYSGAGHILHFQDSDDALATSMLVTSHWLDADAPVDLKVDGNTVHLKLHDADFDETIEFDPTTSLPTKATYIDVAGTTVIAMSDWHAAGAKRVPFKVVVTSGDLTDTFTVSQAKSARDAGPASFAIPEWKAKDTTFDGSKPADIETKRAFTGHVLVHPLVNGKDIGWFILDSGAEIMVIDPKVADTLSLVKLGEEQLVGVGGKTKSAFRFADDFELGPIKVRYIKFAEFDLDQLSKVFRVKIAGIVGYDIFRRSIITLDLSKPSVAIYDPAKYTLPSGTWTTMVFDSGNPVVEANYEGSRKGLFRLDTGANGAVTFHAPTVEKEHLLDGRKTTGAMSGGVGGMTVSKAGQITYFELGGHKFENVQAIFSQAKIGAFTDRYLSGNIGQDLLMPFTVVFDFGGSRLAFLPSAGSQK